MHFLWLVCSIFFQFWKQKCTRFQQIFSSSLVVTSLYNINIWEKHSFVKRFSVSFDTLWRSVFEWQTTKFFSFLFSLSLFSSLNHKSKHLHPIYSECRWICHKIQMGRCSLSSKKISSWIDWFHSHGLVSLSYLPYHNDFILCLQNLNSRFFDWNWLVDSFSASFKIGWWTSSQSSRIQRTESDDSRTREEREVLCWKSSFVQFHDSLFLFMWCSVNVLISFCFVFLF